MKPINKRIVVLIDRYLPLLGGAQNNIHELGRHLSSKGFHITILTRRLSPEMQKYEVIDHATVRRFGYFPVRLLSKLFCIFQIIWHLIRYKKNYDLVLCVPCTYLTDLLPAYIASSFIKTPYVIRTTSVANFDLIMSWSSKSPDEFLRKIFIPPYIGKQTIRRATAIITQLPIIRDKAVQHGFSRCELIVSGTNTERFKPASSEERLVLRRRLRLPEDKIIVISTGRYIRAKNQLLLIKAAEHIEKTLHPGKLYLLILGATEHRQVASNEQELKRYVIEKQLSSLIHFIDDVIHIEEYLRSADIFVIPTMDNEGLSNALLEAMACGLPVICSDLPQMRSAFPEYKGLFFSPTDIEALVAHLSRLIEEKNFRQRYGNSLAVHAHKHYSSVRVADQYTDLFYRILSGDISAKNFSSQHSLRTTLKFWTIFEFLQGISPLIFRIF